MTGVRKTRWREVDGVLLLDKPAGISSNQALQRARRLFQAAKAGHAGSLDPLATGLLPVCFGEATKIAGLLLGSRKAYQARAQLGATTDTDDADGQLLRERPVAGVSRERVEAALVPLRGRISQLPPVYSALKQGGEPLYAKARRGEAVVTEAREVDVHALALTGLGPDWLELDIECGSGTYVRSLVRDLGEALGCGAHVAMLRRLWVEPFFEPAMLTLGELEARAAQGDDALDGVLLPIEAALPALPRLALDSGQARRLAQGQPVAAAGQADAEPVLAVATDDGRALGLVAIAGAQARPRRLFRWA